MRPSTRLILSWGVGFGHNATRSPAISHRAVLANIELASRGIENPLVPKYSLYPFSESLMVRLRVAKVSWNEYIIFEVVTVDRQIGIVTG